jgi:hypothetical protein
LIIEYQPRGVDGASVGDLLARIDRITFRVASV